jgi:dihydrofolate reductase
LRKVVLFIATSLDAYIARPAGEIDWLFQDQDYGYGKFYDGVEFIVMGRKTYETALAFEEWPHPGKQTFVFTRTGAAKGRPDVSFVGGDVSSLVSRLRPGDGGHIWLVGGSELIRAFLEADLLDELVVSIHPVLLGSGIPLVQGASLSRNFQLTSVQRYETGLVQLAYGR